MWTAAFAPSTGEKTGDFPPVFIQFWVPPSGHKKTPQVCVTYGVAPADGRSVFSYVVMGQRPPIAGCCTHISAFLGLSACQGSLNSSKIVVNEVFSTCLKCPWIQCFQGIIRFRLDFSGKVGPALKDHFSFEDQAGIYSEPGLTRLFAVCTRYPEIEGLKRLPGGRYLCADCTEENRAQILEKLTRTARTKYHTDPAFTVQLIVVSGILQWDYEIQIYIGK